MRYPTRTTAQIADALTPQQQAEVEVIAAHIAALRAENPAAALPPSPVHCWLMEGAGWEWDFVRGEYVGASDPGITYATKAEGLRLVGE